MAEKIFDPTRHAPLEDIRWDPDRARDAIARIVVETRGAANADTLWPIHPEDGGESASTFYDLYSGAAGIVWALDTLTRAGFGNDLFRPDLDVTHWIALNREAFPGEAHMSGLLSGDAGLLVTAFGRAQSDRLADEIEAAVAANLDTPAMELMWGAPGSMLVALEMHRRTRQPKWGDLLRLGAEKLSLAFQIDTASNTRVWTQSLWGRRQQMLGLVHGFAGNALALIRAAPLLDATLWKRTAIAIAETLERTAVRGEGGINWPSDVAKGVQGRKLLVQICHGAPGMIVGLSGLAAPIDGLLCEAGETIWRAGPLAKGSNLCHGTAGNGFAFLKLFSRTGDEMWLARARAFAMHAIAQNETEVAQYGMRRYSLWTGDLGVALYLRSCIAGDAEFPTLDVL